MSSCGEDSNTGLSQERASNLRATLDDVEARVASSDCTGAAEQAGGFRQEVDSLPSRVDRDLRDALEQSATRLESLVADQCKPEPSAPVEEPPVEDPTTTDETGSDQQGQGKKDKKPKKQKDDQQPPDTGVTGPEGSTGVTGDGGVVVPGSGE
jgi:hypothetical protein